MLEQMDRVHFIGIGGAGLSAIAKVLLDQGKTVSGSDQQASEITDSLRAAGARVSIGHEAANLADAQLVVMSSAVRESNPELMAARSRGLPVVKRDVLLGEMMQGRVGIGVAGTAGKTTTTAMLAFVLAQLGLDPTFIVGGTLANFETNARAGRGAYFVIEADEYDRMFLGLKPAHAIITNVDFDHPDVFADEREVVRAFEEFVRLPSLQAGVVVVCGDSANARALLSVASQPSTYGFADHNDYRVIDPQSHPQDGCDFVVAKNRRSIAVAHLQLPGRHNMLNACAVIALCDRLRLDVAQVTRALAQFAGTHRRFEVKGESHGVTVIDDYAHHPLKIRATLSAAREQFAGHKIWAVFQPHTFSRTRALLDEFAQSFADADEVIVTDIYPARETESLGVSSAQLVAHMVHAHKHWIPTLDATAQYLREHLQAGDVLLVLGAGDVNHVSAQLLKNDLGDDARGV
jgi:UDP-N-acetylmuramate--alanine ligase